MPTSYSMCSEITALEALKRACNKLIENVCSAEVHLT